MFVVSVLIHEPERAVYPCFLGVNCKKKNMDHWQQIKNLSSMHKIGKDQGKLEGWGVGRRRYRATSFLSILTLNFPIPHVVPISS